MKFREIAPFVTVALLLLSGCVKTVYQSSEFDTEGSTGISIERARKIVSTYADGKFTAHDDGYSWTDHKNIKSIKTSWKGIRFFYDDETTYLCDFNQVSTRVNNKWLGLTVFLDGCPNKSKSIIIRFMANEDVYALDFAKSVSVLKGDYINRSRPESDQQQAAFDEVVRKYHSMQRPILPEDVLRYKAQALFAVEQKRFDDAVDLYGKALDIAPWWAVGHYNRAMILGEIGAYKEAARGLQKYLKLEPDAENSDAIKTKIYQWEGAAEAQEMN